MASSIHESLSPQAHCPSSHLLLCVPKPLPGPMVTPYQYKLFPSASTRTPVPAASFYLLSPILTAASSLHSLSSHPQTVSSLCHPLCHNSLSQPHTLSPAQGGPASAPHTHALFLILTSVFYGNPHTHSQTPLWHPPGVIFLLVYLYIDKYSPLLLHPEFSLFECLQLGYWFLPFHLGP